MSDIIPQKPDKVTYIDKEQIQPRLAYRSMIGNWWVPGRLAGLT